MDSDQTLQREFSQSKSLTHEATQESSPSIAQSAAEPFDKTADAAKFDLLLWLQLLWRHPLVFWGGIWVMLLLVMGIAVTSLMNPELSKQNYSGDAIAGQPPRPIDHSQTVPMWSLGAIALSCTLGSILISQRFKQTSRRRSLTSKSFALQPNSQGNPPVDAPTAPTESAIPSASTLPTPDLSSISPPPLTPSPLTKRVPVSLSPSPTQTSAENPPIVMAVSATVVPATIVPAHESTPLDWEDAGLAEIMDIRYRHNR